METRSRTKTVTPVESEQHKSINPMSKLKRTVELVMGKWGQGRIHKLKLCEWTTYELEELLIYGVFVKVDFSNNTIWACNQAEKLYS